MAKERREERRESRSDADDRSGEPGGRREERRESRPDADDRGSMPSHSGEHGKKVKGGGASHPSPSGTPQKVHGPDPNRSS